MSLSALQPCTINEKLSDEVLLTIFSNEPLRELVRSVALVCKRWRDTVLDATLWRSHIGITLPPSLKQRLSNEENNRDIWLWPRLYGRLQARNLVEDPEWKGSPISSRALGSRRWLAGLYHNIPGEQLSLFFKCLVQRCQS